MTFHLWSWKVLFPSIFLWHVLHKIWWKYLHSFPRYQLWFLLPEQPSPSLKHGYTGQYSKSHCAVIDDIIVKIVSFYIICYFAFIPQVKSMLSCTKNMDFQQFLLTVSIFDPWRSFVCHEDVLWAWWHHQMETFPRYWSFVRGFHRSPVNYPHKGQWRGALMFYLICAWINGWVNNREGGDLRRHRAHYDVVVMAISILWLRVVKLTEMWHFLNLTCFLIRWHCWWRNGCVTYNLHNYTSSSIYLHDIVYEDPVLLTWIFHKNTGTNNNWKYHHLAITRIGLPAGDIYQWTKQLIFAWPIDVVFTQH